MPQIPALKAEAHVAQTAHEVILCLALDRVLLPSVSPIPEFDFDILCVHVGATWVITASELSTLHQSMDAMQSVLMLMHCLQGQLLLPLL